MTHAHADALVVLRRDHRKMIALLAQMTSLSDREQAVAALHEFTAVFNDHEAVEAENLYPMLVPDERAREIAAGHATVRRVFRECDVVAADAPEWWDAAMRLRQAVERQIAREEAVILAMFREAVAVTGVDNRVWQSADRRAPE